MERFHEMLPEDEFLMCFLALCIGVVLGAVARGLAALRERRPS
jgi:hypothetical protein